MPEYRYRSPMGRAFAVAAPCIFTVGRIACGFFAIIWTFDNAFDNAAMAIGLALICDSLDGRVARWLGSASSLGVQLDSLADVVTFGMAPSVLGFYWGVQPVLHGMDAGSARILAGTGYSACCAFVSCAAFRLARFNITAQHAEGSSHRFTGLPAPGAAAVIAAVIHFAKLPLGEWQQSVVWLASLAVLAFLMVSRIGYSASGWIPAPLRNVSVALPLGVLIGWAVWTHSGPAFLTMALVFLLSGPFGYAVDVLRRQGHTAED